MRDTMAHEDSMMAAVVARGANGQGEGRQIGLHELNLKRIKVTGAIEAAEEKRSKRVLELILHRITSSLQQLHTRLVW